MAVSAKLFFVTFVYGQNTVNGRLPLWAVLIRLAETIQGPWCVMGDFNAVLRSGERIGGEDIQQNEVVDFADCLTQCELQEVPLKGAFFTWTNKTIWSRIDRALVNCYWYHDLGLTQAVCISEGLSDHTPIKIKLLTTPGPKVRFKFCDMWTLDPLFSDIITEQAHQHLPGNNLQQHLSLIHI